MPAYAVAHMRSVDWNAQIVAYIQKITQTLEPHGGKFLVHGHNPVVMDGGFTGHLVVIEFPSMKHARAWYFSMEYQQIFHLRRDNSVSSVMLVEGVESGYRASNLLARH